LSTQRDTERALLDKERPELSQQPYAELQELAGLYESKGLSRETAQKVAEELTVHDACAAHIDIELGINPQELTNPWQAAYSSAASFTLGAVLPLLAILLPPPSIRIPVTVVAVLLALTITGWISARLAGASAGHGDHVRHRPPHRRRDQIATDQLAPLAVSGWLVAPCLSELGRAAGFDLQPLDTDRCFKPRGRCHDDVTTHHELTARTPWTATDLCRPT
jgi:hypothetical protein